MIETKYYPPHHGLNGLPPTHGSLEAWIAWPDSRQVFIVAKPGESRASLERQAARLLAGI